MHLNLPGVQSPFVLLIRTCDRKDENMSNCQSNKSKQANITNLDVVFVKDKLTDFKKGLHYNANNSYS